MTTLLRSLVVWLMLLAVPFQAFALATMVPCAPRTHDGAPQMAMASGHDHAAMMADGHDHAAMMAAMAHDGAAPQHLHQDHQVDHCGGVHAKCGDCAACCVGAILASNSTLTFAPALDNLSEPLALYADYLPAVDLAHPERPPQSPRA